MSNVEALKELYEAFGGDPDDFDAQTNPEAILLVADAAKKAMGSVLPAVKAPGDNGKVLTVVNGEWAAAALPD